MLTRADSLVIDAVLQGASNGVLDVYLQRRLDAEWRDFVHFPQLAAGASSRRFTFTITGCGSSIVEVGADTTPALAAGAAVDVVPGGDLRILFVAGAGTTAGASQTISIQPYSERQ